MSAPLRAFLMIRSPLHGWGVHVFRELDELVARWCGRCEAQDSVGVVHIGFERPPTKLFEETALDFPGRVILTAAAKYGLPASFRSSSDPIAEVSNHPVFLGLGGWGYEIEDITVRSVGPTASFLSGWVAKYAESRPEIQEVLVSAGVVDEASYLRNEHLVAQSHRVALGMFRFNYLIEGNREDPCAVAQCSPPWLRERAFSELELTNRLANVFKREKIEHVSDLDGYTTSKLLSLVNFGRTSVRDLVLALMRSLECGPDPDPDAVREVIDRVNSCGSSLLEEIRSALDEFEPRNRAIISRRIGLEGTPETLERIGVDLGITRERVRQIEAKLLPVFFKRNGWHKKLIMKLRLFLQEREFPLPVSGIEAVDNWFSHIGGRSELLSYILRNSEESDVQVVCIDGIDYFSRMSEDEWQAALAEARQILSLGVDESWSESHCRALISPLLPGKAREFHELLWEKATASAHFALDESGERMLSAFGRGADQIVQAVLDEAEGPLHFTEIAERASQRANREIDVRRAHNAAAEVGILLGRGIYGTEKHLPLPTDDLMTLAYEAEDLVSTGPEERQWHVQEILEDLIESGSTLALSIDKYILNFALTMSKDLRSLGRMVWIKRSDNLNEVARLDINQAVLSILQTAGGPLTTSEIHKRLVQTRGVNQNFQILPVPPLVRVGPARWGINDRDVAIKLDVQPQLVELLIRTLEKQGSGIHITELRKRMISFDLTAEAVFSIASNDPRLRVSASQYLYLSLWGEPRRESLAEAASNVLKEADVPLLLSDVQERVEARLGRKCDRAALSHTLVNLEISSDADGRYLLSKASPVHYTIESNE